jgi:hypothetical protein
LKLDRQSQPRLRHVEAFPIETERGRMVALRDPAGFTSSVLVLPIPLLDMVSLFDGEHSIGDIQEVLTRRRGQLVMSDEIVEVAEALDEGGFLDSARFAQRRREMEGEFREAPLRPATHAGGAYAGDPEALRAQMDGFFDAPDGPGTIRWAEGARERPRSPRERPRSPRGLIAPHIDFHRGGTAYAWGYRDLAERCPADCFVILGTCHSGMADPFAVTLKDYDTPLGPAPVDREFVDALSRRAGQDLFGSELSHRAEHSIEFQAVFLRYLFAGRREITIVPVLASFVHEAIARDRGPEDDPRVPRFLDALGETIAASSRRVCVIAGADLAHVGPRFGDPDPVSPPFLAEVEREDLAMLTTVTAGDAQAFFASAAKDGDRRRICGLSPIYALLRTVGDASGALRRYGQWPDPQGTVTFASVVMS